MNPDQLKELKMAWCEWVETAVDIGPNSDRAIEAEGKFLDCELSPIRLFDELERLQKIENALKAWEELINEDINYDLDCDVMFEAIKKGEGPKK